MLLAGVLGLVVFTLVSLAPSGVTPAPLGPSTAAANLISGCGWPIKSDPNIENVAYPDQSATYWGTPFEAIPGAEMTITGHFPLARYFSFHIYEGDAAVDNVTDDQIVPATGTNPYVAGNPRTSNGTYTLHVVLGDPPAGRAPNTLYAGSLNGEPNAAGVILFREYLPQGSATGGVPLPTVTYTSALSGVTLPCVDTSAADDITLNQDLADTSLPLPSSAATKTLSWGVNNSHTASKTKLGSTTVSTNYDGNFNNKDNTYLSLLTERTNGDVVAFRAKAPTYVQTVGATTMPSAQVRYFSICTNEFASLRYIACLPDQSLKVDSQGYINVVISDTEHKPTNLTSVDNWIPAGPYPDTLVLYRQMVPNPSFTQASANVLATADAPRDMGAYYPQTVQCTTAAFETNRCGLPVPTAPASASTVTATPKTCARPARLSFVQHPAAPVRETAVVVSVNGRVAVRRRARAIRTVSVARPRGTAFTVKLVATLSDGEVVSHSYRYSGCRVSQRTVVLHRARAALRRGSPPS